MLTVLMASGRGANCFTHHPDWDQFDVLGRQLAKQTYRDFELVVVTPFHAEAKKLVDYVDRLTIVEPRDTPWRREKMFAVASARNTGLVHARGAWVVVIDDCVEFEPDFLARVIEYADHGTGVAVMYKKDGRTIDPRWNIFEGLAGGKEYAIIRGSQGPVPYGFISFPIDRAVAVNGYDELRFDGARGLEDMNFARRLMQHGLSFAMDRRIMAALHDHLGYPPEVIDNENQNARCCNTAHHFSLNSLVANKARYTTEEKQKILNCMFWRDKGKCGFHGKPCAYPKWAEHGHPVARRVMQNDEEALFDLAVARREIGL